MKKILIAIIFSMFAFSLTFATDRTITVDASNLVLRTHTMQIPVVGARNCVWIPLSGLDGCNALWFNADNSKSTMALLLLAISEEKIITITYDIDQPSPWGDGGVKAIECVTINQ